MKIFLLKSEIYVHLGTYFCDFSQKNYPCKNVIITKVHSLISYILSQIVFKREKKNFDYCSLKNAKRVYR